jgi:Zn-dependent peptidase ImmA (M78 family)
MNELVLEKAAYSFRLDHGLNNNDPIRFKSLLQKINVISVFAPLTDNFSGMALKAKSEGEKESFERFMLINSNQSLGKQHFTICHELYHLYIQPNFTSQVCKTGLFDKKADKNEYSADVFASFLLLPTEGLLENIPNEELQKAKITLRTILFIENFYSCSRRALLYRLKKMQLIKSTEYELYTKNIIRGAIENGYQTEIYEQGNHNIVIGNYGSMARELYEKEKISQSHYYTLLTDLGIDISKINETINGE